MQTDCNDKIAYICRGYKSFFSTIIYTDMEYTDLLRTAEAARSIRRFDQSRNISRDDIMKLIALARLTPSSRNAQPLKYYIAEGEICNSIFPLLGWAGYYKDWDGPEEGERPAAYLVQCRDNEISQNADTDCGIQLEAITLGAASLEFGSCKIKCFDSKRLSSILGLEANLVPEHVIALGYPAEKAMITDLGADGDFRYFRKDDVQCVPKRRLEDLVID